MFWILPYDFAEMILDPRDFEFEDVDDEQFDDEDE